MKKYYTLFLLLLLFAVSFSAQAQTTHTVSNETQLNDAITTINAGSGGDIIKITANILLTANLSEINQDVTITADSDANGKPTITIDGNNKTWKTFIASIGTNVTIENLIVTGSDDNAIEINGSATIKNCITNNSLGGITISGNARIINTTCCGNSFSGIYISGSASIVNSTCSQNDKIGIEVVGNASIINTTCYGNSYKGIFVDGGASANVYNSIIYASVNFEDLDNNAGTLNVYNTVYGNLSGPLSTDLNNDNTNDPILVAKKTDGSNWEYGTDTDKDVAYYTVGNNAVYGVADKSLVTIANIKPISNTFFDSEITQSYVDNARDFDQLGVARVFTGNAYVPGSIEMSAVNTLVINSTADPTESGKTTLRDALITANSQPAVTHIISFDPTVFPTTGTQTITLGSDLPQIAGNVKLTGTNNAAGRPTITIDGNQNYETFSTAFGTNTTIENLIITGALDDGIEVVGNAIINNCIASNNPYGIYVEGNASIINTTCSGNDYDGILASVNAGVSIVNTTCSGNNYDGINISGSATASIVNTTCSGNTENGIRSGSSESMNIYNSIIYGNGSAYFDLTDYYGTVNVYNTVYSTNDGATIDATCSQTDPTLLAKKADGSNATAAEAVYYNADNGAVYQVADSTGIKSVLMTASVDITSTQADNAILYDQLGVARTFTASGKYIPGSIQSTSSCIACAITTPPVGSTVCSGGGYLLSVTVTGTAPQYQWQKGGVDIPGATNDTYEATESGIYTVMVSNTCTAAITSNEATVAFLTAPVILAQPVGATLCVGENHTFRVKAEGTHLSYQWYVNNQLIQGAKADSLVINSVEEGHNATYKVVVTGDCGVVNSTEALLWAAGTLPSILEFLQIPSVVYPNESYRIIVGNTMGYYPYVTQYSWSFSNNKVSITPEALSSPNALLQTGAVAESGILTVRLSQFCGEDRTLSRAITFNYPTGMGALNAQGVKVYPNPVMEELRVENGERRVESVVVTDLNGKTIYRTDNPTGSQVRIAANHWAKGMYLVKVTTDAGSGVEKVVKK